MIRTKTGVNISDLKKLHKNMKEIFGFVLRFCGEYDLELCISSLIRKGDSGPHGDGRGIDLSTKTWSLYSIAKFEHEIKRDLNHLGATSHSDNKQRVCIYHDAGTGFHLHLQCKK